MSLAEVLAELPSMSVAERQELIRSAVALDDSGLSPEDERLIEARLSAHDADTSSAIGLDEMKARLLARSAK
ncbi:hypothetical protein OKA04_03075 [Luteolibacter flavescens]|uniref:Addiction module protein n=1 Tax=Luteolibacter flavescens TaxID=1859460 RepID=A0ABT3FK10_9BACT|nr:hypothetical protein [Luteolibacter flavescens]MCW1883694.1 hypothetical protein [Luteolibacter flavescens]